MMYWINSGYKCRVSDRGAHFFDRRPVLCNNIYLNLNSEYIFFPIIKKLLNNIIIINYLKSNNNIFKKININNKFKILIKIKSSNYNPQTIISKNIKLNK